jgi:hypothetical protein
MAKNQNLSPEQLREALSLLKQLKRGYEELGQENIRLKGIDATNLEGFIKGAGGVKNILKQWTIELDTVEDQLDDLGKNAKGIFAQFSSIVGEINKSNKNLSIGNKAMTSLQGVAEKLKDDQQGITDLNKKDLLTLIQKRKQSVSNLDISIKALEKQKQNNELSGDQLKNAEKLIDERKKEATAISDLNGLLQDRLEEEEKIESKTGLSGKLIEGFKKIPILGDVLDIDGAKEAMRDAAKTGASGFSTLGAGIKALGPSLTAALGPLALIGVAVMAFKSLINMMFEADKQVTDLAKSLNISKDAAIGVRESFFQIKEDAPFLTKILKGNLILQEDLVKTQLLFNELLGTSVNLSAKGNEELVAQLTNANKFLKLNEEEFKGLTDIYFQTGKTVDDIKNSILGTTKAYKLQTGVQLNERKILGDVLKTSNSIKLSIKGGTDALIKATINANQFGTSLDKLQNTASGLLDFEQSISDEMNAELLLGKDLNLERARAASLSNDQVTLTEEIGKLVTQFGPDFQKNAIAQDAFAATLKLSREELADMYTTYQQNEKLAESQRNVALKFTQKEIDLLEAKGEKGKEIAKAMTEGKLTGIQFYEALKTAGYEGQKLTEALAGLSQESLEAQSAQEKFDDALKSAKETFTRFVDGGSLDKFADFLSRFVQSVQTKGLASTLFGGLLSEKDILISQRQETEAALKNAKTDEEKTKLQEKLNEINSKLIEENKKSSQYIEEARKGTQGVSRRQAAEVSDRINRGESGIMYAPMGPKFAEGGIVNKPVTNATIGEAGPEAVIPLNQFYKKLDELIIAVKSGGNIYLDGTKVGTAMATNGFRVQ